MKKGRPCFCLSFIVFLAGVKFRYFKLIAMSLRTQYEFLFVGRDEGSFVENYAYDLGEGGDLSGKIFINIEIQNNPVDAEMIGEMIFDSVRKSFFADLELDPYQRFEEAVRSANKALVQFKEEKVSKYIGNLNVVVAAIVNDALYLTQTGEAEAYLIRRRLCTTVSEGLNEETDAEFFNNIASGTLEPGDFILFCSTRLLRYISKNELSRTCSSNNLVVSLSELKENLSTEILSKVAIIGIGVQEVAPNLNENEKGQIFEHLEKEEIHSSMASGSSENTVLQDVVGNLTKAVNDLGRKVSSMMSNNTRDVRSRLGDSDLLSVKNWNRDRILAGVIIIVLMLTAGIWWIRARADEQKKIEGYVVTLNEVQEEISSAITTGQFNKEQAGEMLTRAEQKAIEVLNANYNRDKANDLLGKIQETRDSLDGVMRPEIRLLSNLSEKRSNISAIGLLGMNNMLFGYEYNALYPVTLNEARDPLTIDENEIVLHGTTYEDKSSLMFYTKSGKVVEYKDGRTTFVDVTDGPFKTGVAVKGYSNKFYILSPEENQIWRYVRRKDKFDAAEPWNVNADLKGAVSFAIDGNVYVLKDDGTVLKIFSGSLQNFSLKKVPINAMENPTKIYTALELNQIFILEPSKQRVIIFDKDSRTGDAVFSKQLVFDDLQDMRDLYVDPNTSRLYIIDQANLYEVAL
jgi:hypothetical protein